MPQRKQVKYLIIKYITNVAQNIHFRVNKKKQRKTWKNKEKQAKRNEVKYTKTCLKEIKKILKINN
jgi:hypothetical protein